MRHQKSDIETYHIVNRGVNNMNIFRNKEDKDEFLSLLEKGSIKYGVKIYAYCLMDNHYHLLVQTDLGKYKNISGLLRYTNSQYVKYYNKTDKVDEDGDLRSGTLFGGSYKSVPVNNSLQIEKVIAYIHNNPTPLTDDIETYEYSSYHRYLKVLSKKTTAEKENSKGIALEFSSMSHYTADEFRKMTKESSKYKFFEGKKNYVGKNYLTDELLMDEIKERYGIDALDIMNLDETQKCRLLFEIDKIPGTSRKQIERVLRINYAQICNLIRKYKKINIKTHSNQNITHVKKTTESISSNVNKNTKVKPKADYGDGST